MKYSTRELVTLTVFGTLWGVVEIGLGSVLHAIRMPLSGLLLAALGLVILLIGRLFVPRRGASLFIGVVAMLLKLFSIGSVVAGPMIGIMVEAAIIYKYDLEMVSTIPNNLSYLLIGNTQGFPFIVNRDYQ